MFRKGKYMKKKKKKFVIAWGWGWECEVTVNGKRFPLRVTETFSKSGCESCMTGKILKS